MNKIPVSELKAIVGRGGGMVLDCKDIPVNELKAIAGRASETQAQVILKNPSVIPVSELKAIAGRSKGCVIFDFYDE